MSYYNIRIKKKPIEKDTPMNNAETTRNFFSNRIAANKKQRNAKNQVIASKAKKLVKCF
jgi:hypothetical protein